MRKHIKSSMAKAHRIHRTIKGLERQKQRLRWLQILQKEDTYIQNVHNRPFEKMNRLV